MIYNDAPLSLTAGADFVTFNPNVQILGTGFVGLDAAVAAAADGPMDWACASATNKVATAQGLNVQESGAVAGEHRTKQLSIVLSHRSARYPP